MKKLSFQNIRHMIARGVDTLRRRIRARVVAYRLRKDQWRRPLRSRSWREPNGRSFYSLRKARNRGWVPPQPDFHAQMRHAWKRKQMRNAALRKLVGQD